MRVGFICPKISVTDDYERWLKQFFSKYSYISFDILKYPGDFKTAISLVNEFQDRYDGLLFSGFQAYNYCKKNVKPQCEWEVIKRHGSALLRALLEAQIKHFDISNISIDTYSREIILRTLNEIGIDDNESNIKVYKSDTETGDDEIIDNIYQFHRSNYKRKRCSCCLTAHSNVKQKLEEDKIPVFHIFPTVSNYETAVNELYLEYLAKSNQNNQIVVVSVGLTEFNEYSIVSTNDYQFVLDKVELTKSIYGFAQDISAAVVEIAFGQYLLFSTRSKIEAETDTFQNIRILSQLEKTSISSVNVGIGYGETVLESKYNAINAMNKAKQYANNTAFVCLPNHVILGPIGAEKNAPDSQYVIDRKVVEMSEITGIGINRLVNIFSVIRSSNRECFLSKDLAKMCGLSIRSMDRIISTLELFGYAKIVGKRQECEIGRPSRLIKISLEREG